MINYRRLAMMASITLTAAATTTLLVHGAVAVPQIGGNGIVAKNAKEGVLLNMSGESFPGRLIPSGHVSLWCTGVLVGTPNTRFNGPAETHAVLTAGHCLYPGPHVGPTSVHFDVGAPYAPENEKHPKFGLNVVHHVDRAEKRDVAEVYPDWISYDGGYGSKKGPPSNFSFLHDLGLICLAEPIKTELPYLDTKTHVHPDNTQDAAHGSDIVVAGRVNFVDPVYPPGLGNFQELFRTFPWRTGAVDGQLHVEFVILNASLEPVVDEGDSGGPAFLDGTHTVIGIAAYHFIVLKEKAGAVAVGAGFSRLDDPNVAKWLHDEIVHCNSTNPPSLFGDQYGGH